MRFKTLCVLVLAVAACGSAVLADDPAPSGNWLSRWFKFDRKAVGAAATPTMMTPPIVDERQARAEAAYLRRTEVCLQLQKIALETNDDALFREAEQLEREIWQHYLQMAPMPQIPMR